MEAIAGKIVHYMKNKGYLSNLDTEWGIYAVTLKLEQFIGLLGVLMIMVVTKHYFDILSFYIVLRMIRRRSGGYHTNSFISCFVLSMLSLLFLVYIALPFMKGNVGLSVIATVVSAAAIVIMGAVNHPNMAWDNEELSESKRRCRLNTLLVCIGVIVIGYIPNIPSDIILCGMFGIIMSAFLMVLAKVIGMEVR